MERHIISLFFIASLSMTGCGGGSSSSAPTNTGNTNSSNTPANTDNSNTSANSGNANDSNEAGAETTTATKPNILLIISDDQGVDASAQYAYSKDVPNTPNLNALAKKGIVFDNAWATPACTTTRGSIITGQHGVHSDISYVPARMDTSTQTLQRFLKANSKTSDYSSAVIGKWHLGGGNSPLTHPHDSGVSYFAGLLEGTVNSYSDWTLTVNGKQSQSKTYHTTKVTDLAIDWINQQANQTGNQQKPWFMWLAYVAPHSPFHLPPSNLHSRNDLSGTSADIEKNKRDYYLAAIEAMDSEIGRLLNSMPAKERDNTVVIFIGDNGTPAAVIDTSVYPRNHSKLSLYEGGIRVPMIVSGNGVTRSNQRESALVNTTDLFATIAALAGNSNTSKINNSYSFTKLLTQAGAGSRAYNYAEFESKNVTGWAVRNSTHKLIELKDGTRALYDVKNDIGETNNLIDTKSLSDVVTTLTQQANSIRSKTNASSNNSANKVDITNKILSKHSANCADYANSYTATANDIGKRTTFKGDLTISLADGKCVFNTNAIPNHDFNDGNRAFPNDVSAQNDRFEITASPKKATNTTALSLLTDNALMLNGVKVDILAAGCFGVENGKIGCHDMSQKWRYDPMHHANGFNVDSHNAHAQGDGTYHYHGKPNALFDDTDSSKASPIIGFAADGFPIFGSFYDDNGVIRKATSSYRLKSGNRPSGAGNPSGSYDGAFRDDYEYIKGSGSLDACNGMTVDGVYGYYVTDEFPYILGCFTGTPDASFNKQ